MSLFGNKHSLSRRVFGTVFVVASAAIVVFTVAGTAFLQSSLARISRSELYDEVEVLAAALDDTSDDISVLEDIDLDDTRLTLIDLDGTVIFDNQEPASSMENHNDRPEVVGARESGHGSSERASSTLGSLMLYEAALLENGMVIRVAQAQDGFITILVSFVGPLLFIAAIVIGVSFFAARRESRAIIAPLLEVDLDHPKRNMENAYSEMVPMLERIESQRQELKRQVKVLADNDRMRREFTANITHELKTPLTTISGYAELIAGGMVVDEADIKDFGGRIHREAGRLTALVNDILTLSNLDEAERTDLEASSSMLGSTEPIDLPLLLDNIQLRLEHVARRNEVTIELATAPSTVVGVPRLLDELAYNLASNAIRYNRPGGTVTLRCGIDKAGRPYLRVEDTGIGIAPEEQVKVFERFYRVDKSRSKARGGTGLGLAIVKHAAAYHGATIAMDSVLDRGTKITVTFPVQDEPAAPVDDAARTGGGATGATDSSDVAGASGADGVTAS